MLQFNLKRNGLFFSILVMMLICGGTAAYIYHTLSQVKNNLANEFHEVYRHTNKLQTDILKFEVSLENFSNNESQIAFETLQEQMDLIFLRFNVVTSMISKLDPESEILTLDLSSRLTKLDDAVQKGSKSVKNDLDQIRSDIKAILGVLRKLSHKRDRITQKSISHISHTLKEQASLISFFICFLTIAIIIVIFLYYKQIKTSHEMNRLRKYLADILNAMPSMLVGVDQNCTITQWNSEAERVTGLSPEKAIGLPLLKAIPSLSKDAEKLIRVMESGNTEVERSRPKPYNNETAFEDITIFPIGAEDVKGAVLRIDDVTDQVRMKEMVIQSEKMLSVGGLSAGMAHEINNPLAGMMQNADVMKSRLQNIEMPANLRVAEEVGISMKDIKTFMEKRSIFRMVDAITESGKRVAGIVENMLNFSRQADAKISSHYPDQLMDQIMELAVTDYDLKTHYDFKAVEIIKEYEDKLPMLPCEGAKIQQVLLNILRNGTHAMQTASTESPRFILRIYVEKNSEMVCMEIEDNGPGMDEKTRSRVFDPFFTTKPVGVGTGLGLSVSYFIITENHSGTMDVISTPGQGATFIIRLPINRS